MNVGEVNCRKLGRSQYLQFKELIGVFNRVFQTEETVRQVDDEYIKTLLSNPDFIVFVIIQKEKVVGGLTAYQLPMYYQAQKEIFIYDIAIDAEFQRMGLGRKLLATLKEYGKINNIPACFVAAHEEDREVLKFYAATGGVGESVKHFNYDLR